MKKLLLILLLFFPVHGALGNNLLYLGCIVKMQTNYEINPVINLDTKVVSNLSYKTIGYAYITDNYINWITPVEIKGIKQNVKFSINRVSGGITLHFVTDNKRYYGKCEKISGKKKF